MKPRAVIDTSVFIRILFGKPQGVANALWDLLTQGAYELILSETLLEEIKRILNHPKLVADKGWRSEDVEPFLLSLRQIGYLVELNALSHPELEARDPSDLFLLQTVQAGKADFLVTQDPDLLDLKSFDSARIVDALDFLRFLRSL